MNGEREKAFGDPPIGDVENSAKAVLSNLFDNLKGNAAVLADQQTRLFFPNGIELIMITVKIGTIDIELKIAGAKGISGFTAEHNASLDDSAT
jgi:hypothetical protein